MKFSLEKRRQRGPIVLAGDGDKERGSLTCAGSRVRGSLQLADGSLNGSGYDHDSRYTPKGTVASQRLFCSCWSVH